MDANLIFDLFGDPRDTSEEKVKEIIDFSEHPYVLMGMFTRIIQRGDIYNDQILKFFSKINKEIDTEMIQDNNTALIYNRAYSYLCKLDLSNDFHVETLLDKADNSFITTSDLAISYFTSIEDYEKCIFIKKIKDFILFSQKKLVP